MTHHRAEPAAVVSVDELVASPRLARALTPDAARDLYAALAPLVAELQVAATSMRPPAAVATASAEVWLTPDEVATRLKTTRAAVYGLARRADWRHFCTRPNRRTLRINGRGLDRWLARQISAAEATT
jgi:hypothetical protein